MSDKVCKAWMKVVDDTGLMDDFEQKGILSFSQPPVNVSLSPSSGTINTGSKVTLTSVFSDADGYSDFAKCYLLMNTSLSGINAAYVYYDSNANKLYVRNDANTAWIGGFQPGTLHTIENSQCKLYCSETTTTGTGANLTIRWRLELKPTMAGKTCPVWLQCFDDASLKDSWEQKGSFSIH